MIDASTICRMRAAMEASPAGAPPEIVCDGRIHRYMPRDGRKKTAWYATKTGAGSEWVVWGDWRNPGEWASFCARNDTPKMTPAQRADAIRAMAVRDAERAAKHQREAEEAAADAIKTLAGAGPVNTRSLHRYIATKQIANSPAIRGICERDGLLLIPITDPRTGRVTSLQTIAEDGTKRFIPRGRVQGCIHQIERSNPSAHAVYLCEGFATGASIAEVTGATVLVAFSCGNLDPVAAEVSRYWLHDGSELVICADDDRNTRGNPGMTAAREAAHRYGALLAVPKFKGRDTTGTDFNDLMIEDGLGAVSESLFAADVA